jgi:hypothetical protein
LLSDVKFYAAAVTPEDDLATGVGGAVDTSKKFDFSDFVGPAQVVSDNAGDTFQTVTLTFRDATGAIGGVAIALNGLTVVSSATAFSSILKAVKSSSCSGNVALESQTAAITGTVFSLGAQADEVVLPVGASAISGFYSGKVFRATGGTGSGKIAEVISYDGPTRAATLSRSVVGVFDATTTFRIADGVFFDKTPAEIMYVVRMDYNSQANPPGSPEIDFYEKGYFKHTNAGGSNLTLSECAVLLAAGPVTRVAIALDTSPNGSGSNGAGNNRQVAPASGVTSFDGATKAVPGGVLAPGSAIGVWMRLADPGGGPGLSTTWTPGFQALTVNTVGVGPRKILQPVMKKRRTALKHWAKTALDQIHRRQ